MSKKAISVTLAVAVTMLMALISWAAVPPPPVNQTLGIQDGVFNNVDTPICRDCHENPAQFPGIMPDVTLPDRHHLLHGTPIPDPNSAPNAPDPLPVGATFECLTCHTLVCDPNTGICDFDPNDFRLCTQCHTQIAGQASVHHLTITAQGADCQACHGSLVDNIGDGHYIPTYAPSLVTPTPSTAKGPNGEGACTFCHAPDPLLPTGPIKSNSATHHGTGFVLDNTKCVWCHDVTPPTNTALAIRTCENCHGPGSLHNVQADSNADGVINPGNEMAYYGHIGHDDDCFGCHGFTAASAGFAPGSGPVAPTISSASHSVVIAGVDTAVTLNGAAFVNLNYGGMELASNVVLEANDGSAVTLTPDAISEGSLTFTVPASLAAGNYGLRAVKYGRLSNLTAIAVKPPVAIERVRAKKGKVTITGSGFSDNPTDTGVALGGVVCSTTSWTDTEVKATCSTKCGTLEVGSVFGTVSATIKCK